MVMVVVPVALAARERVESLVEVVIRISIRLLTLKMRVRAVTIRKSIIATALKVALMPTQPLALMRHTITRPRVLTMTTGPVTVVKNKAIIPRNSKKVTHVMRMIIASMSAMIRTSMTKFMSVVINNTNLTR